MGKLGVRDVLFGGRVSYVALAVLAITALVIGFAGGWVGPQDGRGRRGVHHVEGHAGNQQQRRLTAGPVRESRCGDC